MTPAEEALYLAQEQLDAALQLLAALVLTDEEATAALHAHEPSCRDSTAKGWAEGMREDMLDKDWRPEVVEMLIRRGFSMNTHPGFALAALKSPPAMEVWQALEDINGLVQKYRGDEFVVPTGGVDPILQAVRAELKGKHKPEVIDYAMRRGGASAFLMATLDKMAGSKKGSPA